MLRILTYQVIAAVLGAVSIGGANWLYNRGYIRQRLHDLSVSASSTAICLPLLIWTIKVFLGFGVFSQVFVGAIAAIMFLWIYHTLRKVPTEQIAPYAESGRAHMLPR
jgi:drug/metabolite transporter (DMT)-like permease